MSKKTRQDVLNLLLDRIIDGDYKLPYMSGDWENEKQMYDSYWEDEHPPRCATILYAVYNVYGYEGDAFMICKLEDGKIYENSTSHCSCNGLAWNPEEVHPLELFQRAVRKYMGHDRDWYGESKEEEPIMWITYMLEPIKTISWLMEEIESEAADRCPG